MKKLLIVGNKQSVHTNNLLKLVGGYFDEANVLDSQNFTVRKPLKLFGALVYAKNVLQQKPSFIILYQIDVAAFFVSLINRKFKIPTLVVGIGSDVLVIAKKNILHRKMAQYVMNHGKYFNAGSYAIERQMRLLSKKNIDILIANLGTEDIKPLKKQDIIFSNRLNKPIYNLDKVLEAFKEFVSNKERLSWQLVIATYPDDSDLRLKAKELAIEDKVVFVGWLDKQKNDYYYGISKLWISLAQSDSISISLLEAMSAQCIPIIYNVEAIEGFLDENSVVIVKQFEGNFIEKALHLDENTTKKNRILARDFSDKQNNQQKFYSIFDKEFKHENSSHNHSSSKI